MNISHLNALNEFRFQRRPKKRNVLQDEAWHNNVVFGEHTLGKKMEDISRDASLSEI